MGVGHALLVDPHTCQKVEKAQAASSQCDPRSHSTSTSILIQKIAHTIIYLFLHSIILKSQIQQKEGIPWAQAAVSLGNPIECVYQRT